IFISHESKHSWIWGECRRLVATAIGMTRYESSFVLELACHNLRICTSVPDNDIKAGYTQHSVISIVELVMPMALAWTRKIWHGMLTKQWLSHRDKSILWCGQSTTEVTSELNLSQIILQDNKLAMIDDEVKQLQSNQDFFYMLDHCNVTRYFGQLI